MARAPPAWSDQAGGDGHAQGPRFFPRRGGKTSKITVLRGRRRGRRGRREEKVTNLRNLVKSERNFSILDHVGLVWGRVLL